MKAQPLLLSEEGRYSPCEVAEATHICLNMPGSIPTRILPVITKGTRRGTPCWTWNGSVESPTLKPSILSRGGEHDVCHSFVTDGKAHFLPDSTHEFSGQTVDLLDVDW